MKKTIFISTLSIFLMLSYNSESKENTAYIDKYYGQCSETTLCADGYTTLGIDMFGNKRDYIYPKVEISKENYVNKFKSYDLEGYDEFGFDRNGIDKNNKHYNDVKIMVIINE